MGQNLGCDTLEIIIPQGVENESNTLIKHCPEDVTELNDTRCASFNITDSTVNCSYTSNYTTCIVSPTVWFSVFGVYESVASIINNVASSSSSGSSGSSGGSSGSSSGGSGGSNNFQILYFGNITNQSTTQLTNQNYSLTELTLNVNVPVKDVKVFIEKKKTISTSSNNISQELGSPYQFFTLTSPQITDKEISSAKIKFKVENSWLKENNFNASRIFLLRYNGVNWIEETTILTSKDLDYAYFEAETRYLGEYSISYIEPNELAYILMASLNPILDDLKAVIESGLSDAMLIDKIGTYLSGKLDVPKTLKLSKELVNDLKISRKVSDTATLNLSKMSVSIKNNKNDSISFLYVEAVPKSLVHDIYFLKNFKPRIYDIIIREDPVIQWSFGEADTSIVAWEIKDLKPGDTAEFSYELDVKIDVTKYPAPIIIKPTVTLSTNVRAEEKKEDLPINENTEESVKKNKKLSIILTTLLILSIIGAVLSVFIKNKKNKNKSNEFKDNETNKTSNEVEKLSKYIEKEKSKGKTENDIKHALENVGWDDETINKGFLNKK